MDWYLHRRLGGRKRALFVDLPPRGLELAAGVGASMRYLAPGTRLVAIEPNPHAHDVLRRKAARLRRRPRDSWRTSGVNRPRHRQHRRSDHIARCTVEDQTAALAEVRRILRPGGRFVFIEHVESDPGPLRALQRLVRRPWRYVFDGCCLDRDTAAAILGDRLHGSADRAWPTRWCVCARLASDQRCRRRMKTEPARGVCRHGRGHPAAQLLTGGRPDRSAWRYRPVCGSNNAAAAMVISPLVLLIEHRHAPLAVLASERPHVRCHHRPVTCPVGVADSHEDWRHRRRRPRLPIVCSRSMVANGSVCRQVSILRKHDGVDGEAGELAEHRGDARLAPPAARHRGRSGDKYFVRSTPYARDKPMESSGNRGRVLGRCLRHRRSD